MTGYITSLIVPPTPKVVNPENGMFRQVCTENFFIFETIAFTDSSVISNFKSAFRSLTLICYYFAVHKRIGNERRRQSLFASGHSRVGRIQLFIQNGEHIRYSFDAFLHSIWKFRHIVPNRYIRLRARSRARRFYFAIPFARV